jgi:hypothetical protein
VHPGNPLSVPDKNARWWIWEEAVKKMYEGVRGL